MKRFLQAFVVILLVLGVAASSLAGSYTTHGYFYKPGYGEKGAVVYSLYNSALEATDAVIYSLTSLTSLISNWVIEDQILTMISVTCTYSDNNTFTLPGDYTSRFATGAVVQIQVAAGMVFSTVASSSYAAPTTTVNLNDTVLTDPITRVYVVATRDGLWPNGPGYVVARDYGTDRAALEAADAVAAAAGKELLITVAFPIDDDVTLESPKVSVQPGVPFAISTTKTLTINGSFNPGPYQVFACTGTGKVVFGPKAADKFWPDWWTAHVTPGTTDMTAAVQAAVTAATTNDLWGRVTLLGTTYKLTSPITAAAGFTLDGIAPGGANVGSTDKGGGTWFYLAHTGKGFSFLSTGGAYSDAYVKNLGTYRDQPAPGVGWAPTAHDYDFYLDGAIGVELNTIFLFNATKGIWAGGNSGRPRIYNIKGQCFDKGIVIASAHDKPSIAHIHFWPYWSDDANVKAYMKANFDAIQMMRSDGPALVDTFSLWGRSLLRISQGADEGAEKAVTTNLQATNFYADEGLYGLWIDNTVVDGFTGRFANFMHQGVTTGSIGILGEGANATIEMANVKLDHDDLNAIKFTGTGNQISITNLQAVYYNQSDTDVPAVDVATGNILSISPKPLITSDILGTGGIYAGAGQILVDAWRSYTPTVTAQTGTITTVGDVVANYKVIGSTVYVTLDITITTNGTGAGDLRVTLPYGTPATHSTGSGKETVTGGKGLMAWIQAGASYVLITNYDNTYPVTDTSRVIVTFEYLI
jgi:hypothetical protein